MAEKRRNIGAEILQGIRELKAGKRGRIRTIPSAVQVRKKLGVSQSEFARLLRVSLRTLQDWEQGRRAPSGAARTLLMIADKNPRILFEVS
ncbi:MAG TPA: helix-turn-helix domain-containing protein [Candidatus Limnocylindrales bacterium]|nr:helix-turn-helix domain-containing protein [Candidatus Limnocylindrales bacterium]